MSFLGKSEIVWKFALKIALKRTFCLTKHKQDTKPAEASVLQKR